MTEHARSGAASRGSGILLFISRKYPPSVGGMEQLSYYVTTGVARKRPARIIKWDRSQMWLLLFIPIALVQALIVLVTTPVAMIHIGDLVLAPLGWFLRSGQSQTGRDHGARPRCGLSEIALPVGDPDMRSTPGRRDLY